MADYPCMTVDGWIEGTGGTASAFDTTSDYFIVGQRKNSFFAPALSRRGLLKFNTSGIPDNHNVTDVKMTLTVKTDYSTSYDFDVQIMKHNWSAQDPITSGNMDAAYDGCIASSQESSIWRNTSGIALDTPYTSGSLDTTRVDIMGYTYYSLKSSRDPDYPPGNGIIEEIEIYSQEASNSSYRPILVVTSEVGVPTELPSTTVQSGSSVVDIINKEGVTSTGVATESQFDSYYLANGALVITKGEGFVDYNAFPGFTRMANNKYICTYSSSETHLTAAVTNMKTSEDGTRFSPQRTIYSSWPLSINGVAIMKHSTGKLMLTLSQQDVSDPFGVYGREKNRTFVGISPDNGDNWGSKISMNCPALKWDMSTGRIIERPDGTLMGAMYGSDSTTYDHANCYLVKSVNGGTVWTPVSMIANGYADGKIYAEPELCPLDNGRILCFIRNVTDGNTMVSYTDTEGSSWSTPVVKFTGTGAPRAVQLQNKVVLCTVRTSYGCSYFYSTDRAENFSGPIVYDDRPDLYSMAYEETINFIRVVYGAIPTGGDFVEGPCDIRLMEIDIPVEVLETSASATTSIADNMNYIDVAQTTAEATTSVSHTQEYKELLETLANAGVSATDIQTMVSDLLTTAASAVEVSAIANLIETLSITATAVAAVNESQTWVETLNNILQMTTSLEEVAPFCESFLTTMLAVVTAEDKQLYVENVNIMAASHVSLAEIQSYIMQVRTDAVAGVSLTDVLVGNFVGTYIIGVEVPARAFETTVPPRSFIDTVRAR